MSELILQLTFTFNGSVEQYHDTVEPLAADFAEVPGLKWKVWLVDERRHEAGGLYLFENQEALDGFLRSGLAVAVMGHPMLTNFSAKPFDVIADVSAVTRAPVGSAAPA